MLKLDEGLQTLHSGQEARSLKKRKKDERKGGNQGGKYGGL